MGHPEVSKRRMSSPGASFILLILTTLLGATLTGVLRSPSLKEDMPYSQQYEEIARECEACHGRRRLVIKRIQVSSRLIQLAYQCLTCGEGNGHCYDLTDRRWAEGQSIASGPTRDVLWSCENRGCEWSCYATRLEASLRFLRIAFRCPTCQGTAIRYYDLEQHGYVDVTGLVVPHSFNRFGARNYTRYVGAQWERL
jgi:hypothetical protein